MQGTKPTFAGDKKTFQSSGGHCGVWEDLGERIERCRRFLFFFLLLFYFKNKMKILNL